MVATGAVVATGAMVAGRAAGAVVTRSCRNTGETEAGFPSSVSRAEEGVRRCVLRSGRRGFPVRALNLTSVDPTRWDSDIDQCACTCKRLRDGGLNRHSSRSAAGLEPQWLLFLSERHRKICHSWMEESRFCQPFLRCLSLMFFARTLCDSYLRRPFFCFDSLSELQPNPLPPGCHLHL